MLDDAANPTTQNDPALDGHAAAALQNRMRMLTAWTRRRAQDVGGKVREKPIAAAGVSAGAAFAAGVCAGMLISRSKSPPLRRGWAARLAELHPRWR